MPPHLTVLETNETLHKGGEGRQEVSKNVKQKWPPRLLLIHMRIKIATILELCKFERLQKHVILATVSRIHELCPTFDCFLNPRLRSMQGVVLEFLE